MKKFNNVMGALLTAIGLGAGLAKLQPMTAPWSPIKRRRHRADEGMQRGNRGDKLARKAATGMLTKCHRGLAPSMLGKKYPFSAKRA